MSDFDQDYTGRPAAPPRDIYMIHCNSGGSVFVKTIDFFRDQHGFRDDWGIGWTPVVATSIEDAREKGCSMFPNARPYAMQAKP